MKLKKLSCFLFLGFLVGFLSMFAQTNEPVQPVDWQELTPFLIDLQGWDAGGDAEGTTVSMGTFSMSQAERSYSSGDKSFTINIIDGGYAPMVYAGIKMAMSMEIDTSDEYIKKITVKNFPGVEKYSRVDKTADIIILVSERFIVQIEGTDIDDASELVAAAKNLDLEGIANLAK